MKRFLVIGLGTFGATVAAELMEQGAEVMAVDHDEDLVEKVRDKFTAAAALDGTTEDALREIGAQDFDVAVISIGNLEGSVLTALLLKKIGVPRIVARAGSAGHAQILELVGVHEVIQPEKREAEALVKRLVESHVYSYIHLAEDHLLAEIQATPALIGKTIRELDLRRRYKVNVIAIKRIVPELTADDMNAFREEIIDVPDPESVIEEGDVLMLVGKEINVFAMREDVREEAGP